MSEQESKRQDKKEQFTENKSGGPGKIIGLVVALVAVVAAGWFFLGQGATNGIASVKAENGLVKIGRAHV